MSRTLTLLFRRDPHRDYQTGNINFEGYEVLWPDGKPAAVGLDAFCTHGRRLLGLGKHLAGCKEKLVKMVWLPLSGREDDLNRIPGYRVRRFYITLTDHVGRVHFMDGTPTVATIDMVRDDPCVLYWSGLNNMRDGETQWFDLAAVSMETAIPSRSRKLTIEA